MILREIAIRLGLDVNAREFAAGELAAKGVEKAFEKLVEWGKEAIETFKDNVFEVVEYGDKLNKLSQSLGLSVKDLQELQYAGSLADISAEEMSHSINILTRTMGHAAKGSEEQAAGFKKLGVSVKDAHGKLRPASDVMEDIAEKLSKMPDGAEKTAAAMQLFGRSGSRMIPLLNQGKKGLAEMRQEAEDLGLVVSKETTEAAEEFNDTLTRIKAVGVGLWRQAIAPLIPAMTELAKRFLAWRKENAAILKQYITKYIGYLIKAVKVLVSVFQGLIEILGVLKSIFWFIAKDVIGAVLIAFDSIGVSAKTAAMVFATAWIAASAPLIALGAIIAGVLLVLNSFRRYRQGKDSIVGDWIKMLDDWLKPKDTDTWFVTAIKEFIRLVEQAAKKVEELYNDIQKAKNPREAVNKLGGSGTRTILDPLKPEFLKRYDARVEAAQSGGAGFLETLKAGFGYGQYANPTAPMSGRGGNTQVYAPVSIDITQQPGQSSQELADIIDQRFQMHTDTVHENAQAALSE